MSTKPKIVVILGATASGKTALGIALACRFNGEIVSADSRQVYRGMDIGTAKDLPDYTVSLKTESDDQAPKQIQVPYHLIDVAEPSERYDLAAYKRDAEAAIADILQRGKLPIIVGGSGMYLEALIENYQLSSVGVDQALRTRLESLSVDEIWDQIKSEYGAFADKINDSDRRNKRRLIRYLEILTGSGQTTQRAETKYQALLIGLALDKAVLETRIMKRIKQRLETQDMIEEVSNLNRQGLTWQRLESFGLEYKFISWYLQDKIDYEQMVSQLYRATLQFAKRQVTWFKRWSKKGAEIHWLESEYLEQAERMIANFLQD